MTVPWRSVNLTTLALNLSSSNCTGTLPALWSQMTQLTALLLHNNALTGEVPQELSALVDLQQLDLGENALTGTIPKFFSAMTALSVLDLSLNVERQWGPIPQEFSVLTGLVYLDLSSTSLNGTIPKEFSALTLLTYLDFTGNALTGPLPALPSSLSYLGARQNRLHGPLPLELSAMTQMTVLSLGDNSFTGPLPKGFSALTNLSLLKLWGNQLTSTLPKEWAALTQLSWLLLYNNLLNGTLPTEYSEMVGMSVLEVDNNLLTGTLPEEYSLLVNMTDLTLGSNDLSGTLPKSYSELTLLNMLDVDNNYLSGPLPQEWSVLSALTSLFLDLNLLSGTLPSAWSTLTTLNTMQVFDCSFTGPLPAAWSNLQALNFMDVDTNKLTGTLPKAWSALTNLAYLELDNNLLTGSLPHEWSTLTLLTYLNVSACLNLNGTLPTVFSRFANLAILDLDNTAISGTLPSSYSALMALQYLDLSSGGNLIGTLPKIYSVLTLLDTLDLHNNNFQGSLPTDWGSLGLLTYLDLATNRLSNTLPQTWGFSFPHLAFLDLADNMFTSTVPLSSWSLLTALTLLNLSSNQLSGSLPPVVNPWAPQPPPAPPSPRYAPPPSPLPPSPPQPLGDGVSPRSSLPLSPSARPAPTDSPSSSTINVGAVVGGVVGGVAVLAACLAAVLWLRRRRRQEEEGGAGGKGAAATRALPSAAKGAGQDGQGAYAGGPDAASGSASAASTNAAAAMGLSLPPVPVTVQCISLCEDILSQVLRVVVNQARCQHIAVAVAGLLPLLQALPATEERPASQGQDPSEPCLLAVRAMLLQCQAFVATWTDGSALASMQDLASRIGSDDCDRAFHDLMLQLAGASAELQQMLLAINHQQAARREDAAAAREAAALEAQAKVPLGRHSCGSGAEPEAGGSWARSTAPEQPQLPLPPQLPQLPQPQPQPQITMAPGRAIDSPRRLRQAGSSASQGTPQQLQPPEPHQPQQAVTGPAPAIGSAERLTDAAATSQAGGLPTVAAVPADVTPATAASANGPLASAAGPPRSPWLAAAESSPALPASFSAGFAAPSFRTLAWRPEPAAWLAAEPAASSSGGRQGSLQRHHSASGLVPRPTLQQSPSLTNAPSHDDTFTTPPTSLGQLGSPLPSYATASALLDGTLRGNDPPLQLQPSQPGLADSQPPSSKQSYGSPLPPYHGPDPRSTPSAELSTSAAQPPLPPSLGLSSPVPPLQARGTSVSPGKHAAPPATASRTSLGAGPQQQQPGQPPDASSARLLSHRGSAPAPAVPLPEARPWRPSGPGGPGSGAAGAGISPAASQLLPDLHSWRTAHSRLSATGSPPTSSTGGFGGGPGTSASPTASQLLLPETQVWLTINSRTHGGPPEAVEAEAKRADVRAFVRLVVRNGGWKTWDSARTWVLSRLCSSCDLNLTELTQQEEAQLDAFEMAKSQARAGAMLTRMTALVYIRPEDLLAPPGATKPGLQYLCNGGFGAVYRGMWQGEDVAVKKVDNVDSGPRAHEEFVREAYIMSTCRHPNIAEIYGLARDTETGALSIVMRFYPRGSLRDVLDKGRRDAGSSPGAAPPGTPPLTLVDKLQMALDIARGMAYLHGRPNEMIVHGDIKPANILVDERTRAHIADFGLASMKTNTKTLASASTAQSLFYSPPELLEALAYSGPPGPGAPAVKRTTDGDVFSYGMLLYELFTGLTPFAGANVGQVLALLLGGKRPFLPPSRTDIYLAAAELAHLPHRPEDGVPLPIARIIESCWRQDPLDRPVFSQVTLAIEAAAMALQVQVS